MKKLILAAFALTTAASVFAQGTITFNNNIAGLRTRVYAPLSSNVYLSQIGNGSIDTPASTTSWAGYTAIGSTSLTGLYGASTTLTELLGATGLADNASSLLPSPGFTTTFKSGAGGGIIVGPVTPSFANIPKDYAGGVTLEMVAWDESAGPVLDGYNLLDWGVAGSKGAYDAWQAGLIAAGVSGTFDVTSAVGGTGTSAESCRATAA